MKTSISNKGLKTLLNYSSWQTNNKHETLIEFEPMGCGNDNFLHINSMHKGTDGKRNKSTFIHRLSRQDVEQLRVFLNEMLRDEKMNATMNKIPEKIRALLSTPGREKIFESIISFEGPFCINDLHDKLKTQGIIVKRNGRANELLRALCYCDFLKESKTRQRNKRRGRPTVYYQKIAEQHSLFLASLKKAIR